MRRILALQKTKQTKKPTQTSTGQGFGPFGSQSVVSLLLCGQFD